MGKQKVLDYYIESHRISSNLIESSPEFALKVSKPSPHSKFNMTIRPSLGKLPLRQSISVTLERYPFWLFDWLPNWIILLDCAQFRKRSTGYSLSDWITYGDYELTDMCEFQLLEVRWTGGDVEIRFEEAGHFWGTKCKSSNLQIIQRGGENISGALFVVFTGAQRKINVNKETSKLDQLREESKRNAERTGESIHHWWTTSETGFKLISGFVNGSNSIMQFFPFPRFSFFSFF